MKLLISSDWHMSDDPRDAYRFRIIDDWMPALIKKHQPDALLYLGDICEAKDEHSAELVNAVVRVFHELAKLCPIVVAQGNHDWLSSPDNPFFGFLSRLPNIHWVRSPTPLRSIFGKSAINGIVLPHSANPERDWSDIDFKAYDWAFAHQTFVNAQSDSGFRLSGVSLSFFPKHLKIISGDVHSPQTLGPVTYVGSPFHVDFGDSFEPRALLLDDRTGLRSIPIEGAQKRLVEVKSLKELKRSFADVNEGDIVKVRVALTPEQQNEWADIARELRTLGADAGVVVHSLQPVITGNSRSMSQRREPDTRSDEQLLKDYAAARGVDDKTLKTGLKLL